MKKSAMRISAFILCLVISCTGIPFSFLQTGAQVVTNEDSAVISDDFEDYNTSKKYWNNQVSYKTEDGNHYLSMGVDGLATPNYYNKNQRLEKMHISVKPESTFGIMISADGMTNNTVSRIHKGLWIYTYLSNGALGMWGYDADNDVSRILNDSPANVKTEDSPYIRFKKTDWVDIDMQFDYSKWADSRTVSITYQISGTIYGIYKNDVEWFENSENYDKNNVFYEKDGTVYHIGDTFTFSPATYNYTFDGAEYDAYLQLGFGSPESNSSFSVDNYSAKYVELDAALCHYLDSYRNVLNGTATDTALIAAAVEAYTALPVETRDILKEQYAEGIKKLVRFAEENNTDKAVSDFKTNYAILLNLESENINPDYAENLADAFEAYNALNEKNKFSLYNTYLHLLELQKALDNYVTPRPDGNLSDWIEDFSSGSTKNWVLTTKPNDTKYDYYANIDIVGDPDDPANNVLKFEQCGGFMLTPNTKTWPSKGAMTNVSYRFRGSDVNVSYRHKFYVYYIDEENYAYICVSGDDSTYLVTVTNGQIFENAQALSKRINVTDWMNIETIYDHKALMFAFTLTDVNGETITWGGSLLNSSGRFAIGQERNAMFDSYGYVDDIHISFIQGDWDVNDTITEIEPYYSGNVWMNPGDIVTFSGENLGALGDNVQLIRVGDISADTVGNTVNYPGQQTYKYNPDADSNSLMLSMDTLIDNYTFTDEDTVPIEQVTVDSIKFRIPKTQTVGIYAVKLTNKNGKDALLFINNPHLGFVQGEDGASTPVGGDLRIIGRKIIGDDYTKSKVALVDPESKKIVRIITPERSEDKYSLHITVPANLETKTYEVYVHNGFGDNTLWSEAGKIKVTASDIRSTWSNKIFDVTEYGAVGDLNSNDTPAFVAAFEAASANGGGIVYVPAGVYTLIHTITIPKNVSFMGDGVEKTHIIWDVGTWDIGDARTLMSASGNIEIGNISFYSSRRKEVLYLNGDNANPRENVYVHDIRVKIYGLTETMSDGAGNVGYDGVTSLAELRIMLYNELNKVTANFWTGEAAKDQNNLQFCNIEVYLDEERNTAGFKIGGYYNYLNNVQVKQGSFGWSSGLTYDYGIMEYCDLGENHCCGIQGNNWYIAHNNFHDNTQNNRELYSTDGGCLEKEMVVQLDKNFSNGCVYNLLSGVLGQDLSGRMIMVASGQGYSQVRTIVSNTKSQIVVDQPFAVTPNRNSRLFIHNKRTDSIFVENKCSNGGSFGSYGTMIDYVFDGNEFKQAMGYNMDIWTQFIWGVSMIDSVIKDPFYTHGTSSIGGSDSQTGYHGVSLRAQGAVYDGAMHNILVRNVSFTGGARLEVTLSGTGDSFKDLVVQGNTFSDTDIALQMISTNAFSSQQYLDGWIFADNSYVNCKGKYNSAFGYAYNAKLKNKANDFKIKFVDEDTDIVTPSVFGDANGDGVFTLKDVSYVQYYLIERITVDDEEAFKRRADVTGDGKVDLRDVNLMRKAISAGGWENIEMPDKNPESTYTVTLYDGKTVYKTISVKKNGTYSELASVAAPIKENYEFEGWYTAETGGTKVDKNTAVIRNEPHNLYAHWVKSKPNTYTVTYMSDGVSVGSKTVSKGDTYGAFPSITKTGYKLKGWYLNEAGSGSQITETTTVLSMSHTIYAVWEKASTSGDISGEIVDDRDVFH